MQLVQSSWVAWMGIVMWTQCAQRTACPAPPHAHPAARLLRSPDELREPHVCVSCAGLWAGLGRIVSWLGTRTVWLPSSSWWVGGGSLLFIFSAPLMYLVDPIVLPSAVPFTAVKSLLSRVGDRLACVYWTPAHFLAFSVL